MPLVDIVLVGRKFSLSCEPGQEARLRELADYVAGRLKELTDGGVTGTDAHLLVMTCILLADELFDLQDSLEKARSRVGGGGGGSGDQDHLVGTIDSVTRRIEDLATRLDRN
jgi:cell division protein ZapA